MEYVTAEFFLKFFFNFFFNDQCLATGLAFWHSTSFTAQGFLETISINVVNFHDGCMTQYL